MDKPLTPQQVTFLKAYLDPKSDTWSNALQSALKAGYSQEYSESITHQMPDWLSENLVDNKLIMKANKNLEMALEGLLDDPEKGARVIQWKATETTLKGLQKTKWADRKEITGADGKELPTPLLTALYVPNNDSNETSSEPIQED